MMKRLASRPLRYGVAVLAVELAVALRLIPGFGRGFATFFFFAVLLSAWFGGLGPGLLATVLTVATTIGILIGLDAPFPPWRIVSFVLFLAGGILITLLVEALHALRRKSEAGRSRLGAVLASIGDAVITTDREGNVLFLNRVAEALTGWQSDQAVGRPLPEVFVIVDEASEGVLEDRVARVLESGSTVGPTRQTVLKSRNGARVPLEESASPIRDVGGESHGVVLVFRDVTERRESELALGEANRRVAQILESVSEAFVALDRHWIFTYMNPEAERLTARKVSDVIGRNLWEIFPETRGTVVETELVRARVEQTSVAFESYQAAADLWFEVRAYPSRDEGLSLFFRDISRRKMAGLRLNLLAEAGRILGMSLDGESSLANLCTLLVPSFADWCAFDLVDNFGQIRRLEVAHTDSFRARLAQEIWTRYPPRAEDGQGLAYVLRTGELEAHFQLTDEQLVRVARDEEHLRLLREFGPRSVLIVPLKARGRTLGAMSLVMAESPRRFNAEDELLAVELGSRAALAFENARLYEGVQEAARRQEEALQRHRSMEEQLTLLVEASDSLSASLAPSSVLSAILTLSRRLVAADSYAIWRHHAASNQWGIVTASGLSEEYQRSTIRVLEQTPDMPELPVVAENVGGSAILGDRNEAYEKEGIRSLLAVPLRVRGTISGSLVFYYRVPHRFSEVEVGIATALANLAASAIGTAELYEELRGNDRRKEEFLAMLSHELRNPLSAIRSAVQLYRESNADADREWAIDAVTRQVEQLGSLIDDLLDISRVTHNKIQLRREVLDLAEVLDRAAETAAPLIRERRHSLSCLYMPGTLAVEGDPSRLEQIVVNLLTNAAKYSEPGGQIALSATREGDEILVRVKDSGIGIAADLLPNLFDLFTQGDRSIDRAEGGLGIGLTLVKTLAELHGGGVSVSSRGPGQGSEFVVRLPAAKLPVPSRNADPPRGPRQRGRARVLVVDDNTDSARSVARLLTLSGYQVRTAHDGRGAIAVAREQQPEFVLLDIGLPGMDGHEVAETLRADASCEASVFIAVSGYGDERTRRKSRDAGFDEHFVKPLDFDALLDLLARRSAQPLGLLTRGEAV